uniref:Hemolysin activation/secretion protein n=1 Tax=Candidatus Kentrum sp. DK TaxID=2126562 RepID=A0A450TGT5_9GAMM|nr:MAG: Hemolysin activation/secretion protein [Candidatus Kentron sp. DK]
MTTNKHSSTCLHFNFILLILSQNVLAEPLPGIGHQPQQYPGAGSQMQQLPRIPDQRDPIPIPTPTPTIPTQENPKPIVSKTESIKIIVNRLKISSAPEYSEAELIKIAGFTSGSELSLSDLRGMAKKVADYYRRNGFFAAQAYLPAQDIKDGVVIIAVIAGQYGKITVNNKTNLSDALAKDLLSGLNKNDPIKAEPLERSLLLLSDLPGVRIHSTLVPGEATGTSDLLVDIEQGQRFSGSIDGDNAGNRYTGAYRTGGTFNINNMAGHGDVASLRVLTSGPGLNYGRASYRMQFGKATVGAAYSYLQYNLGEQYEDLDAHGSQKIADVFGSYPLLRTRDNNLHALVGYEERIFQDKLDSVSSVADREAHVFKAGLYGDHRDNFIAGGTDAYSLTLSSGAIDLKSREPRDSDAATAKTQGDYSKLTFYGNRQQNLNSTFSLYASVHGQWASKNLDPFEKMELGGMNAVRAYPEGEAYGDAGYVLTAEVRMRLPTFSEKIPGQTQLTTFMDTGTIISNTNRWTEGDNTRTLSGIGVGLDWMGINNFLVRGYYAHKLGSGEALSGPDSSGRFWLQTVKYF